MPAELFISLPLNNGTGVFDYEGASRLAPVTSDVVSIIGGTPTVCCGDQVRIMVRSVLTVSL
jgi:hypothetical protein